MNLNPRLREIERCQEGGRDWDHEGTRETLEAECTLDRTESECSGHEFYVYDDGHYLVWRIWSDEPSTKPACQSLSNSVNESPGKVKVEAETQAEQEKGFFFSARTCRGRIKGGSRVSTITEDGEITVHVDFTLKGHKLAHRKAVRDGLIPRRGPIAKAFLKQVLRAIERGAA
jgi:hypothetical protein